MEILCIYPQQGKMKTVRQLILLDVSLYLRRIFVLGTIELHRKKRHMIFPRNHKVIMRLESKPVQRVGKAGVFDGEDIRESNLGINLRGVASADLAQSPIRYSFRTVKQSLQHLALTNRIRIASAWNYRNLAARIARVKTNAAPGVAAARLLRPSLKFPWAYAARLGSFTAARLGVQPLRHKPILQHESGDVRIIHAIVGHQYQAMGECGRSDQEIQIGCRLADIE